MKKAVYLFGFVFILKIIVSCCSEKYYFFYYDVESSSNYDFSNIDSINFSNYNITLNFLHSDEQIAFYKKNIGFNKLYATTCEFNYINTSKVTSYSVVLLSEYDTLKEGDSFENFIEVGSIYDSTSYNYSYLIQELNKENHYGLIYSNFNLKLKSPPTISSPLKIKFTFEMENGLSFSTSTEKIVIRN